MASSFNIVAGFRYKDIKCLKISYDKIFPHTWDLGKLLTLLGKRQHGKKIRNYNAGLSSNFPKEKCKITHILQVMYRKTIFN